MVMGPPYQLAAVVLGDLGAASFPTPSFGSFLHIPYTRGGPSIKLGNTQQQGEVPGASYLSVGAMDSAPLSLVPLFVSGYKGGLFGTAQCSGTSKRRLVYAV